jgi:hypothetical protein
MRFSTRATIPIPVLVGVLVFTSASGASAASSQAPETFDQLIAGMSLVVVASVSGSASEGYTYTIEHVLKGTVGPTLRLPSDEQSAVQPGWTEVVIAFTDPATDDFRAPTVAWHVAADGTIDPERYAQYPGLPPTLDAMLAAFGLAGSPSPSVAPGPSPTSAAPTSEPNPSQVGSGGSFPWPLALFAALIVVGALLLATRLRRR